MPSPNLTTFYIVRHGQTDWNAKRVIQGHTDIPLNETGAKQAKAVAQKLKDITFDLAISSDLVRAKKTAEIIALESKLIIEATDKLRERTYGIFEGKPSEIFSDYLEKLREMSREDRQTFKPDESFESDNEVSTRTMTFLRETAVTNPGKTILVATHGGVMRMILLHLGHFDYQSIDNYRFENTSYFKLTSDGVDFFVEELSGITKIES